MNGERPRKLNSEYARWKRSRNRTGDRVPETLVETTVKTAVHVVRCRNTNVAHPMSRSVQQLVHEALLSMANQKWQVIRMVLQIAGAAGVGAGWAVLQLLVN